MTTVPRTLRRIIVAGVGTSALAVAATTAISSAGAATPTAGSPTPSPATAAPTTSGAAPAPSSARPPAPQGGPGKGGPGHGPQGGPKGGPKDDGVVTAVSSSALTVKDDFGTSHVYVLNSATTYHAGPKTTLARTAIQVGDRVHVRTSSTSSKTAVDVDEHLPHIDGTVTAISSGSITVTDHEGFQRTIATTGSTTWTKAGATVSSSTVKVGTAVHAEGKVDANRTTLDAMRVDVRVAPSAGS